MSLHAVADLYGRLKPISESWDASALEVSGFTREQLMAFDEPKGDLARARMPPVASGRRGIP
jgi:hypothetical protein